MEMIQNYRAHCQVKTALLITQMKSNRNVPILRFFLTIYQTVFLSMQRKPRIELKCLRAQLITLFH